MSQFFTFLKTTLGKITALGVGLLALCTLCFACSIFGNLVADDEPPDQTITESIEESPIVATLPAAQLIDAPTAAPTATLPRTETPLPPTPEPTLSPTETPLPPTEAPPEPTPTETPLPPTEPPPTEPPPPTEAPLQAAALPDVALQEAQVSNIVDGDTIDVLIEGVEYRIRYILVDTPETHGGTEPFGPEASEANAAMVAGQTVWLEKDVSETDRYGRLLRYVYLADGRMVNEELLRQGMATVATFPPDVKYVDRFLAVQAEARDSGVGLWGEPGLVETEPTPAPQPQPTVAPAPAPASGGPVAIVAHNKEDEYTDIQNVSDAAVDLAGWVLHSEKHGNQNQDCPLKGVIQPGEVLRIWAMSKDSDKGGFNCGFGKNIWNNDDPDAAVLFDPSGATISRME